MLLLCMSERARHVGACVPDEPEPIQATLPQVKWWRGSTASGSSGSPLIDMDTQQVVGVLTGGYASCVDPNEPDYYGRLSAVRLGPPTPLRALHARACCTLWSYPPFRTDFTRYIPPGNVIMHQRRLAAGYSSSRWG